MTQVPARTFGNTLSNQRSNIWTWGIFSAALFLLLTIFSQRQLRDISLALLVAAMPAALYGITFLFRLRFDAETVSHEFLRRFTMSKKLVQDLTRVEIGRGVGATLAFRDGSHMRFLGADIRVLRDMCRYIEERWPNQVEMRSNAALAALIALDSKARRDA